MRKPIGKFRDLTQLRECAEYYIELLGLQDWAIAFRLSDDIGDEYLGYNNCVFQIKSSIITLRKEISENEYFNYPHECTLIHELLHCKYPIASKDGNYESEMLADLQHQVLEDMAKAIFKARFNLTNEYFIKQTVLL